MGLILARTSIPEGERSFLDVALLLVMMYIGLVLGTSKGDMLNLQALGGLFGAERGGHRQPKILDTSVIIDGRVADICEAYFLEGALLVPQFVLRELQTGGRFGRRPQAAARTARPRGAAAHPADAAHRSRDRR